MRFLIVALFLAACAPQQPTPTTDAMPEPPTASATEAAACTAKGGTIRPVCRMQNPMCVITYKDAGKACTDGGQCDGDCRAESIKAQWPAGTASGICTASNDPCGCFQKIVSGVAQPALCVD